MRQELVKDWMSAEVVTATPHTTLPAAHRLMEDYQIRRLPVVKDGKLVGIITLGDVRRSDASDVKTLGVWELDYILSKLAVEKIMTTSPVTVSPQATISEAAKLMLDYKVSGLPVVDDQLRVVGIITESDIFRLVVKTWKQEVISVKR